jgi:glycosyltransferase involved in cell wall biosynthesis
MNLKNDILFCFRSLKKYGAKGVVDFVIDFPSRIIRAQLKRRRLMQNIRVCNPDRGITLVGRFKENMSLSKSMRDFARQLKKAEIPYQTFDISERKEIPQSEYNDFLTPENEFCVNRYSKILSMQGELPAVDSRCENYIIHFWEFEDGFCDYHPEVYRGKNILALSDFNLEVFSKSLPKSIKVRKVLYPFQFDLKETFSDSKIKRKFGLNENDFLVFFNFSFGSSSYRKNPEGVVRAFAKSIGEENDAKIVFKTSYSKQCPNQYNQLRELVAELKLSQKVIFINDYVPQDELIGLTNACDVYISLHRGEGLGLGIIEAMYLGKPVIVTNYSAVKEFCNSENSCLISYKYITPMPDSIDHMAYSGVKTWIEPNVDEAAEALRRLYMDVRFRKELGIKAQEFVKEYFSVKNFKTSVEMFLSE